MTADFEAYFRALAATSVDDKTEHMDRGALQILLQAAANDAEPGAQIQHEPRRDKGGAGSPDFKVVRQGRIAGYLEVKQIDENLSKVLKSDQIKKYKTLSDNIVLTDYLEFCWIKANGEVVRHRLAYSEDLTGRTLRLKPESIEAVSLLLRGFFSAVPQRIGRAQDLALALASRARMLRDFLTIELTRQAKEHQEGRLHALFQVFREQVFHDLNIADFADAFAQTLAYGLFLARLNAGESETVTLNNVRRFIPGSFNLIRELVRFLEDMNDPEYQEVRWVVEEVLSIVNGLDLGAIQSDLSFRARKAISRKVRAGDEEEHRLFERDPFIYFYEDFLKAYDPAMRKSRGVYYTPPPIVNFIVRAVDDTLKTSFGIRDGLADHNRVTVLDFACGTGTFLLEVFQRVFDNIGGANSGRADPIVREHLTRNMFGFEYLIAPYTIAHLKLSQYLRDQGHPLRDDERLQVFLTNTLEPVEPQRDLNFPAISAEVEAAQRVKDRDILVIVGNPPYSGHSKNKGAWITAAIDGYKYTIERRPDLESPDGLGPEERIPLGERNPKWLNDDYVKFIRFAQLKMDEVDEGIVGIITNHSWLDNPTFRGMRQSLMRTFDQIHVLDLHGNTKKKERAPDGGKDENVFDIEQGVAISLFVKKPGLERGVWRGDFWGKRLEKYKAAAEGTFGSIEAARVKPESGTYLFTKQDSITRDIYKLGWSLPEIFPKNVLGFQTHRDGFAVAFTDDEMRIRLNDLADSQYSDADIVRKYGIRDNRDWSLQDARWIARTHGVGNPKLVSYRPFDLRWAEYSGLTMDYPRRELMDNVVGRDNITIVSPRQIGTKVWQHAFVAETPANDCLVSNRTKEASQVFPLWSYEESGKLENISSEFRRFVSGNYSTHYSAQEILGYVYAILNSRTYRKTFEEFLRAEFPRIMFPRESREFEVLSGLGWSLCQGHLLRDLTRSGFADFHGTGDRVVESPRYSPAEHSIWINKTQSFANVPGEIWDFEIGGYQVLDKYLKSRKGRVLSLDEINHVAVIADALSFTISQMEAIDVAYRAAFPDNF